jgi:hypothetical protein
VDEYFLILKENGKVLNCRRPSNNLTKIALLQKAQNHIVYLLLICSSFILMRERNKSSIKEYYEQGVLHSYMGLISHIQRHCITIRITTTKSAASPQKLLLAVAR